METDGLINKDIYEEIIEQENFDDLPIIMSSLEITVTDPLPSTSQSISQQTTSVRSLRNLRPQRRASVDAALHKIKRRVLTKPKKIPFDFSKNNDIQKYYLSNKVETNFKPSNLETIYEESPAPAPVPTSTVRESESQTNFIGLKKFRRSMSFSDGLNLTKVTINNRRKRIKRFLGRNFKINKMSMKSFMDRLETLESPTDDISSGDGDVNPIPIETQSDIEQSNVLLFSDCDSPPNLPNEI